MARCARQFMITQIGVSAFTWKDGRYLAKTYNFYAFPL